MNVRAIVATSIYQVLQGTSLAECLPKLIHTLDHRDAAQVQAMSYGICRWYFSLGFVLQVLLSKPLKNKDQDIFCLLLVGLYQLVAMRIPDYAAISATVSATQLLKKAWAKNLVNGVLRQFQREWQKAEITTFQGDLTAIPAFCAMPLSAVYSHPDWMIKKIQQDWPNHWQFILTHDNQHPPLALRVNSHLISREQYLVKLAENHIAAKAISETSLGIVLLEPCAVEKIPGFLDGEVSVQDGAAQLAVELLQVKSGQRILDACAAPGGKTTHILTLAPDAYVLAIEQDQMRGKRIHENLTRLRLSADCRIADAADIPSWWDGQLFDRILLDAPCSASGVIRRHPDIKLLRRQTDIERLQNEQLRLLQALLPLLAKDGVLVYSTCSIFLDENVQVIKALLQTMPQIVEQKIHVSWGIECEFGRQLLPGMAEMDGFYYCCLAMKG